MTTLNKPLNRIMDSSSIIARFNLNDEDFEALKAFQPIANKNLDAFLEDFYMWMPTLTEYRQFFSDVSMVPRVKAQQKEYWRQFFAARIDQEYINSRLRVGRTHAQINLPINTYCVGMNFSIMWWLSRMPAWTDAKGSQALSTAFMKCSMVDLTIVTESYSDLTNDKIKELLTETNSILDKTTTIAESMAKGDFSTNYETTSEQDRRLAQAVNRMLENFKGVVKQATSIAQGNYRAEVAVLSDKDELGSALSLMTKNLRDLSENNQRDTWVKNGQTELANLMRGNQELHELGKNVISYLAKYLGALLGTFYAMQEDQKSLRLVGSFAYNRRKGNLTEIKLGEGLVGQCAIEKEVIVFSDVPEDYIAVSSSLGNASPRNIIVVPLTLDNEIFGVLELASMQAFSNSSMELLSKISESIAIAIKSSKDAERIKTLLRDSNAQAQELQSQQEELKAANEEMQKQQEKLSVTNQELEHQAQRLKESEESIRRKNEDLRESKEHLERQKHDLEAKSIEVEHAKNVIEAKAKELEQSSKYKSEFLANMSHELRTPLNSLLILSENLSSNDEGNLTPDQVESARVIYSGGKDLLTLINDILDLSKVEAGKLEIQFEKFDVASVLENLRSQFDPVAKRKSLKLNVKIDNNVSQTIKSDRHRLEQILKNFLSNAFKFTSEGSVTLHAHLAKAGTHFQRSELGVDRCIGISVADTGIGIPEDKQSIIFEAFQQVDGSTSRKYGGTGLGLSISRELAKILGCEIHVRSSLNVGSVFTLYIPVELIRIPTVTGPALSEKARPTLTRMMERPTPVADDRASITKGDKTLLIIEDDENFAQTLMNEARKQGYKCLIALTGAQGLQLAFDFKPSAITLDMRLPDTGGLQILDQLKLNIATRHIPVHVVSVEEESLQTRNKGAVGHLKKPASAEDLRNLFSKLTSSGTRKRVLVVEDDFVGQRAIMKLIANSEIDVTCASTANAAFEYVKSGGFDTVILDLNLPDMSGFELLQKFQNETHMALPPVIIYTGRDLSKDEVAELNRVASSIVVKGPMSPDRLIDELHLFLHSVDAKLPVDPEQAIRTLHEPATLLKNRKVLLVDDDMRNTFALSASLRKKGLTVVMADNGALALEKLEKEPDIELIIMDIMMPIMDGYEAMTRIRQNPKVAHLPIIALTAKVMPEDKVKALESGASDFMTKPVDVQKLMNLMSFWLVGGASKPDDAPTVSA